MTKGRPLGHLVKYAVPLLLGNLMQLMYNAVDSIIAGRFIGEDAVSYLDFTRDTAVFLREGEVVSDLIFDDRFAIDGYEISGGLWNDLVRGRTYRPRLDKIRQISK